jgi:hypothetical protein
MFKTKPRQHQYDALAKGQDHEYFAYLMDRGTGKTKVALDNAAILFKQKKIEALLIIAPKGVHEKWVTEQIPLHMPEPYTAVYWKTPVTKRFTRSLEVLFESEFPVLAVNVESLISIKGIALIKNFCKQFEVMTVLDESTRIKTPGAKRTKTAINIGAMSKYRRILTGNEVTKTPFELFSQFRFLDKHFWGTNYFLFQHTYGKWIKQSARVKSCKKVCECPQCGPVLPEIRKRHDYVWFVCPECNSSLKNFTHEMEHIRRGAGQYEYPVLIEYKNLHELRSKIEPFSFRVLKRDCLDLPPKQYDTIKVKMTKLHKDLYEELKNEFFAEYGGAELTIQNKISLFSRCHQIVGGFFPSDPPKYLGSPKLDALLYDLEDVRDDTKVIIWAIFRLEIILLGKALRKAFPKERTELYFGDTKNRGEIIKDFQDGHIKFLVMNPSVGGTGLNLQASNLHYFYSNTTKTEDRWQAEDRSHRDGTHWPVIYKDIITDDLPVDKIIRDILKNNKSLAEYFQSSGDEEF